MIITTLTIGGNICLTFTLGGNIWLKPYGFDLYIKVIPYFSVTYMFGVVILHNGQCEAPVRGVTFTANNFYLSKKNLI